VDRDSVEELVEEEGEDEDEVDTLVEGCGSAVTGGDALLTAEVPASHREKMVGAMFSSLENS
jgi:hypothetical protein